MTRKTLSEFKKKKTVRSTKITSLEGYGRIDAFFIFYLGGTQRENIFQCFNVPNTLPYLFSAAPGSSAVGDTGGGYGRIPNRKKNARNSRRPGLGVERVYHNVFLCMIGVALGQGSRLVKIMQFKYY